MKIREFFTSGAAFVFIIVLTSAVFMNDGYAAAGINVISQANHVWGLAAGTLSNGTYDYTSSDPVLGSAQALMWGGRTPWTESNPGTNTETSFAGDFHVYATDRSCWDFTGSHCYAQSVCLFTPQEDQLQIQFTGKVVMHIFENWVNFSLVDTVSSSTVDSRTWKTENPSFLGINWTGNYDVIPGREYSLTLYAQVNPGDTPNVTSELFADVVPEPATLFLLALGGLFLRRKK